MRIPFKFDRKTFLTSLLFLVLLVAISFIARDLYYKLTADNQKVSTVASSKTSLVSSQQQNIEENKIDRSELPTALDKVNRASINASVTELVTKLTDESKVTDFLADELKKIRDPFQKVVQKEEVDLISSTNESTTSNTASSKTEYSVPTTPSDLSMVDQLDTVVVYQELYQTVQGDETEVEQEPEIVELPLEYPSFLLKGVVSKGGRKKALLATVDQSYIVSAGEQIQGWRIDTIDLNWVRVVNQDDQKFILTLEGVIMDESSE